MPLKDYQSIHQMLKETVERYPDRTAYKWFPEVGQTDSVTWVQFYDQVRQVAKSLMASGIEKGDKVNIISYTCYEWVLADFGVTSAGAATVGIYQSNLPNDCRYIIDHSDAVIIFAEDEEQLYKLMEIRETIPNIRKVVLFKGERPIDDDWVIGFDTFLGLGKDISNEEFQKRIDEITPADTAGIVYTSGTTGVPKGAVLTHDNFIFTVQSALQHASINDGDETFLFLPLAHVYAKLFVYFSMLAGVPLTFARSMDTIIDDIKAARPDWFSSVPRIYEKVYAKVVSRAEAKGGLVLKLFRWACDVGYAVSDCKLEKQPIPWMTGMKYKLAQKLVFSRIREALGGRVRWCVSGAAPLNPDIARFFHAADILVVEGLGMTENTSFSNVNREDDYRFGWVGKPGAGIEQKIAGDGEIMIRGRNVMKEYYKMPEETAKNITSDGWLHTGDLGEIDAEDFLRVTGRKKDLIITAGGKNIAPALIEGVIATSKYINQVCVIGDKQKFLSALVTINPETVQAYAEEHGISYKSLDDLMKNRNIIQLVEGAVALKNKTLASFETVKKITIVPEFTIENGMATPTMKLKKNIIHDKFQKEIDAMYPTD
jgi:long-chain acyl-CoA synthetase